MDSINIELSSTYRNRYKYPNPCDFLVNFGDISNDLYFSPAYPYYNFTGMGSENKNTQFPFITTSNESELSTFGNNNPYGIGTNEYPLLDYSSSNCDRYYIGNYLNFVFNASTTPTEMASLILEYNGDQRQCNLQYPGGSFTNYKIKNLSTNNLIVIQGGKTSNDFVFNSYIEDVNIAKHYSLDDRFKKILNYDATSKLALLSSPFPIDLQNNYLYISWQPTDKYKLRLEKPLLMCFGFNSNDDYPWIYKDPQGPYCNAGIAPNCLFENAVYDMVLLESKGKFKIGEIITLEFNIKIEIKSLYRDGSLPQNGFIIVCPGNGKAYENKTIKYVSENNSLLFMVNSTAQSIDISNAYNNLGVVGAGISKQNDFYKNKILSIPYFVENIKPKCTNPSFYQQYPVLIREKNDDNTTGSYIIKSSMYDKSENKGYLIINCCSREYINILNTEIIYNNDIYSYDWEILNKNIVDTALSTFYSPRNEMQRCYDVYLSSIILPNEVLQNGQIKGLLAFNDTLYLQIYNKNIQNAHTISSNNNNLTKIDFKIPIANIYDPVTNPFIKLAFYSTQNFFFKLNDDIGVRLIQSNGEVVQFEEDISPPAVPNPLKQVTVNLKFIPKK